MYIYMECTWTHNIQLLTVIVRVSSYIYIHLRTVMVRVLPIHGLHTLKPRLDGALLHSQLRHECIVVEQRPSYCLKRPAFGDLIKEEDVKVPGCAVGHSLLDVVCLVNRDLCVCLCVCVCMQVRDTHLRRLAMYVCMYVCR